jgi:hypothetical protein
MKLRCVDALTALLLCLSIALTTSSGQERKVAGASEIVLNDDGAWCWFQDERALVYRGHLIVASVANGRSAPDRKGDVDLTLYHLETGHISRIELHDRLQADDHAAPALLVLPDGRLLAVYSKHGAENRFYCRMTSLSDDVTTWQPGQEFVPTEQSRITYSNLFCLPAENQPRGRIYNFYRGLDASFKPSFAYSEDLAESWIRGNVVIDVPEKFRHRPYVKYASDGHKTIHLLYTEGHPRDYDNSLYHIFYRGGRLYRSNGSPIGRLQNGLTRPAEGTRVFAGNADSVAWCCDLQLDEQGWPCAVYSVQKNSAGLPPGQGGEDHRYRYARWDGTQWHDYEVAYAGSRLYPREDDYTGLICLDPNDLNHIYLSTNANPRTGTPLISSADGQRHYELFHDVTPDGGRTWNWTAVTSDSSGDNLRPIVPRWDAHHTALVWFRGEYRTYTNYETEIVARVTTGQRQKWRRPERSVDDAAGRH